MLKFLIDADTGIDDSLAIYYALSCPEVRVVGITTSFGNTTAPQAAENSLRLIKLADPGYEVPVAIGENKPLFGDWHGPEYHIHGSNGIGGVELPPSDQKPLSEHAADFIVRMAREHGRDLTIITLGRMTNLALALQKEPELPRMVKNVIFMGGTYKQWGNVLPMSEANIFGDPEAADMVFQAGFDITMVGLDVTQKAHLTSWHVDQLVKYAAPRHKAFAAYFRKAVDDVYFPFNRAQNNCLEHTPTHDPSALLYATDPSLYTTRKIRCRVECKGEFTRGMIVPDLREYPFEANFVNICVDVDGTRALEKLIAAFTRE
ncbi:MAG: nucleoside hydrolase [Oscillibacter sp.]|nr:nucleoside hydrolase [Oscillibacter sp.]